VGGPGAGKTLLAREAAIALQRGGRPVAWCDLASVTDSPGLVTALAVATGVDAGPDAFGGAVERLEGALLVLDNAEHLVDEVAELARTIVWKGNRLSVLVTSQRPLRLRNEHIHRLGSLDPSAAAELFKARSKWDAGELDDDRVTAICAAVDRLPLGIELAAGLLRTLTLDQLAVRIDRRMRLLVAGNRDSGARHSSLRAAIDWSYALLDSAGQSVLERLSVFVGGCTLEAAEEVAGGNGIPVADIPVILADLHERSLLTVTTVNGVPRYVLLESIRDFALERLAGEDDAVRREHARWCADLAGRTERYGAADHSDLVRELRAEEANLRAAIAFCLDNDPPGVLRIVSPTWWFWWSHGMIAQGRDWLRRALAAADPAPTLERATALRVTASLTRNSGDFEPARELGEEALAMFRDLGDQRGVGSSLVGVAITSLAVRDFGQALDQATEAAGVFRPMGNERLLCTALNVVGAALRGLGRTQEAEEVLRDVCARWTAIDDPRGLAGSLVSVALIRLHIGDLVETRELLVRAMRLYRQLELTEGVIDALDLLAAVEVVEGRPALALRMLTVAGLERTRIGAPQIMMDELDARDAAERSARAALGITAAGVVAEARAVPFEAIVAEFS
jgi:predicted ATPase